MGPLQEVMGVHVLPYLSLFRFQKKCFKIIKTCLLLPDMWSAYANFNPFSLSKNHQKTGRKQEQPVVVQGAQNVLIAVYIANKRIGKVFANFSTRDAFKYFSTLDDKSTNYSIFYYKLINF